MKFIKADGTSNLPIARMVSERWELAIYPVMFGYRVRAGLRGSPCVSVDYCAGGEEWFLPVLYLTVYLILSGLPEEISVRELEDMLPRYESRPICYDPCWGLLVKMAGASPATLTATEDQKIELLDYVEASLAEYLALAGAWS